MTYVNSSSPDTILHDLVYFKQNQMQDDLGKYILRLRDNTNKEIIKDKIRNSILSPEDKDHVINLIDRPDDIPGWVDQCDGGRKKTKKRRLQRYKQRAKSIARKKRKK